MLLRSRLSAFLPLAGALAFLVLASGCDDGLVTPEDETAPEVQAPLEWTLQSSRTTQSPGETHSDRSANSQKPVCKGRLRLPEHAQQKWRPFRVQLHLPKSLAEHADSTRTRTFKAHASSAPDSRVLLEATCHLPATTAVQKRVAHTFGEVRERLRERYSEKRGATPQGQDPTGAVTQNAPAGGGEDTPGGASTNTIPPGCRLVASYHSDACGCPIRVYECDGGNGGGGNGGGGSGDRGGGDGCGTRGMTTSALDPCDDPGTGGGDDGGNASPWGKAIKLGEKMVDAAKRGEDLLDARTWKKMLDSEWAKAVEATNNANAALNGDMVALVEVIDYGVEQFAGVGLFDGLKGMMGGLKAADKLGFGWYDDAAGYLTKSSNFGRFARATSGEGLSGARKFADDFPGFVDKVKGRFKMTDRSTLQAKYDAHAADFGVFGNRNNAKLDEFRNALRNHVGNSETVMGKFRGEEAFHHYDPQTGLNVVQRPNGEFWTGYKLDPHQADRLESTGEAGLD